MHHKRRRPKNARAGCLLCHPNKANGVGVAARTPIAALRRMQVGRHEASEMDGLLCDDAFCRHCDCGSCDCFDDDYELPQPASVRVSIASAIVRWLAA